MYQFKRGQTSVILRVKLLDSSATTGAGLTGLTSASSGLSISTIADNEAIPTTYTVGGSTIESITTLGTFAAPTATKCRFKEVSSSAHPGIYEIQIADARFAVSSAKSLVVSIFGATNLAQCDLLVRLTDHDPYDVVRGGMTAMPNVVSGSAGALLIDGTGTAAISNAAGKVLLQATQSGVTIPTVTTVTNQLTAAAIATGVWQDTTSGDFTVASSIGKSLYTSGAVPGATGGLFIAGTNAATTVTTSFTTTFTGSLTGSVASVTGNVGGTVATVTNLTNAPTSGDFTATMKTSIGTAVAASAVASVTGSVGSVASAGITRGSFAADTGHQTIRSNTAQAGASGTITLDASASATNSFYNNCLCFLTGGTGVGQCRFITGYVGSTKVATVNSAWATTPDNTTTFAILPFDAIPGATAPTAAAVATAVWQDTTSGDFTVSGSIGKSLFTSGNAPGAASGLALVGSNVGAATSVSGAVGSVTGSVGSISGVTFPTNFSSLGIGSGGHIQNVDTLTTYTGDTPQTGDAYARIGLAGVGLTNLGDTRIAHLNSDVSSRMATYTQPTGFLAATFPTGTIANTTNITAGTMTTTTNVTNVVDANFKQIDGNPLNTYTGNNFNSYFGNNTTPLSGRYVSSPVYVGGFLGDAITEGAAGRIAAAFTQFFNVATPTGTVNSTPTAVANAAALLDATDAIETGLTPRGLFRLVGAAVAGKLSGGGTTTEVMRNAVADSKARITATVDSSGNRTSIVWDTTT